MKVPRMQVELRSKVDHWINKGFKVSDRDPVTLFKGDIRVCWNGERFVLNPLTVEPKSYESKPYDREGGYISDEVLMR